MPTSRRSPRSLVLAGLTLAAVVGAAPLAGCKDAGSARREQATAETWVPLKVGDRTLRVQIMLLDGEKAQGLMFREKLGADEGMLFVERYPKQLSFWMRNTVIPLDIGYFDTTGTLLEVHPMYPRDERRVVSVGKAMHFALELNQGAYATLGLKTGAKLDLVAVKAAIDARGYSPERWGLK